MKKQATRAAAMKMKCHDCCGEYFDGRDDCEVTRCPLYSWMPYRKKQPILDWVKYSPSRVGMIEKESSGRKFTDEQKAATAERLKKWRKGQKINEAKGGHK